MPELPDVQVFKEYLDATSLHQPIVEVSVTREEILGEVSLSTLRRRLLESTLQSTQRHGKYLFAQASRGGWLVLHFGMTGYLDYAQSKETPKHTRLLLRFDSGARLAYICMRMLGTVDWTEDVQQFVLNRELGIDGLSGSLDAERFCKLMDSKRGSIKSALMDQETIAGVGNVYSDEILFQAHVHPRTPVPELDRQSLEEIYDQLRRILKSAIAARVDPDQMPFSFLLPQRGQKQPVCPRCNGAIETVKISGRTAYFCPRCQPV